MQFEIAILTALSRRPGGRATLDELRDDVATLTANADSDTNPRRSHGIKTVDVIRRGLVVSEDGKLRITEAGRSVLLAVQTSAQETAKNDVAEDSLTTAPPDFLVRPADATNQETGATPSWRQNLLGSAAAKLQALRRAWTRHLERASSNPERVSRIAGSNGLLVALLVTLVIIICAGAAIALTQIKSLKTEITSLQRELFPLKDRLSRLDQAEAAKAAQAKAASEKAAAENRTSQAPLILSREEAQLIRDYIKPAPFAGQAAAPIAIGDPITGGTIPLPSPVTDKLPKLLGARFAIRNGAIIIVRKDSRQADAVLPPY